MAHLRIRIELTRTSKGIEMSKLEGLSKETQKLLRSLGEDLSIPGGTWVAQGFYDQGVGFDACYLASDVDELQAGGFIHALDRVLTVDSTDEWRIPGVSTDTLLLSAKVARLADEGETIRFGLYNDRAAVDWRPLVKSRAEEIVDYYESTVTYRGMLQGIIHSLYKESDPPYFDLRDLNSRELVKCFYEPAQYPEVHAALQRRSAVVLVAGWITAKRSTRVCSELKVERMRATRSLQQSELEDFFGSAPGWTGDLTTSEFIEFARRREADGE